MILYAETAGFAEVIKVRLPFSAVSALNFPDETYISRYRYIYGRPVHRL